MDTATIKEVLGYLGTFAGILGLGTLFYFYYTNENVRKVVDRVLPFLPAALATMASRTKDTKGVFDRHDAFVLLGRLTQHIQETIEDPRNVNFEDVENDLYEFITAELERYTSEGVKNVPDIGDEAIRTQVRLAFETIQRMMVDEAPAGSDS